MIAGKALLPARIAILGFARSGRSLASALLARGVEVSVGDDRPEADFEGTALFREAGVRFSFGAPGEDLLDGAEWLVLSPGVPLSAPLVARAQARGLAVLAEFEVAWRIAEEEVEGANRWIAVTGTNGKSTTTSWIAHILRRAGRPVALAGNIGVPLSDFLSERKPRDFVCELSSFQLEAIDRFRPQVAVLTNVTPDHLDRYADFEEYRAAKQRLFENQREGDVAVVNADDRAASSAATGRARRVPFSRRTEAPGGAWLEASALVSEVGGPRRQMLPASELALPGAHNLENALAAMAAAQAAGAPDEDVCEGLRRFHGLPHRTELVAEAAGVRWINDSKGTNVDATVKALEGFPQGSVLLILGGRDKHGDFPALAGPVARAARQVLTIGEAAPLIEKALAGAVAVERAGTMARAVERARELARPGDAVLLSPACASFDQYRNFEERGNDFARLAREVAMSHGS
ncbi:MAG TPA: UDP-N-acetylmuramoyl-L-alanine--D-glutamate ligase [Thermoanaerobaculia bacterium]|nr:UDP-N-acetylmuramoyl-L-alanine--D-glutamate ligase [Thermoanaerobaculia bacterium]